MDLEELLDTLRPSSQDQFPEESGREQTMEEKDDDALPPPLCMAVERRGDGVVVTERWCEEELPLLCKQTDGEC